jgi:hypothetical protein
VTTNEPGPWAPPQVPTPPSWPGGPPGGWQQAGYPVPRRTNGLAIASLVCGCAIVLIWPFAPFLAIAAVITGHMARRRIRVTGEQGAGMALAGLIIGYVGIALSVLAIIGLSILLFAVGPAATQDDVVDDAEAFSATIVDTALSMNAAPRDVAVIHSAHSRAFNPFGCCDDNDAVLPDGTPLWSATDEDLERNGWRIQMTQQFIWDKHACLTVPMSASSTPMVTEGRCR